MPGSTSSIEDTNREHSCRSASAIVLIFFFHSLTISIVQVGAIEYQVHRCLVTSIQWSLRYSTAEALPQMYIFFQWVDVCRGSPGCQVPGLPAVPAFSLSDSYSSYLRIRQGTQFTQES